MSPPLAEMSSNIQESDSAGRKRSHDEFADKARNSDDTAQPSGSEREEHLPETARLSALTIHPEHRPDSTPQGSPALTDSTTAHNSSSPPTPGKTQNTADDTASKNTTATTSTSAPSQPPSKKKRLTQAERDARDKEAAEKKKKAEEEKAAKAREREEREKEAAEKKKKAEEEKQARAREREEKRKKKEEEDKLKTQEREEKKRKKEEEQRAIQEAKDKKARQQPKLMNFFGAQASPKKPSAAQASPQKAAATAATSDASEKPADYVYRRRFQPFFVKENTQWAEPRASDETKSARLDEYVSAAAAGNDETLPERLDAASLLPLPVDDKGRCCHRGKLHRPVKNIMEQAYRELQTSQGTEGAGKAMDAARSRLARIPVKVIAFSQDVRPPYYGTVTLRPYALGRDHMRRLARRPTGRSMPLEYDYDSEAEWQEEEGEDLDADDDEEEIDDEDDMDGFLDDSEDVGPARRAFVNTMEPESTGICFEDGARRTENERVRAHKMEFILEHDAPIDPWSSTYWEPEASKAAAMAPPPAPSTTTTATPAAPANAFAALGGGNASTGADGTPAAKLVKPELLNEVKQAIVDNKGLSKIGIVDYIFQKFRDSASRTEVKNTIEQVAEKKGPGRVKEWSLKSGHEMST